MLLVERNGFQDVNRPMPKPSCQTTPYETAVTYVEFENGSFVAQRTSCYETSRELTHVITRLGDGPPIHVLLCLFD